MPFFSYWRIIRAVTPSSKLRLSSCSACARHERGKGQSGQCLFKTIGGGSGEASVVHAWRGVRSGRRALALLSSLTVWAVLSIVMTLPAVGGVCWRRPSTYPVKASASFCSVLILWVGTHNVGS